MLFYFTLKAISVLKIFKFLSCPFGQVENRMIREVRLTSKFVASQPWKQIIAMHMLPNISRSKGNEALEYGQLT